MGRLVCGWILLSITKSPRRLVAMGGYGAMGKKLNSARISREGLPLLTMYRVHSQYVSGAIPRTMCPSTGVPGPCQCASGAVPRTKYACMGRKVPIVPVVKCSWHKPMWGRKPHIFVAAVAIHGNLVLVDSRLL